MANRRMFSKRIINSARFLKMGAGAQNLYFHLCMNADDDGVVEAYSVKRGIGAADDDLENLMGRGFVIMLDPDNEIALITDWHEHNKLRSDRITPSLYRDLVAEIAPNFALLEPKQRADRSPKKGTVIDVSAGQSDNGTSQGQPTDGQLYVHGTSHGQPRDGLGEVKLSKDKLRQEKKEEGIYTDASEEVAATSEEKKRKRFTPPSIADIQGYCIEKGYNSVDAEYFWNYYENLDWKIKGQKMKNWRLAVSNWDKRQKSYAKKEERPAFMVRDNPDDGGGWWS